ncbi:hypothetical protein [Halomicrobium salinisoli]|uniref:hypothetical protein n=1 Tax=Halomicrobium salinisoli TaxID=2878391 RepID=UPI001CEFBD3B|nr:hypothetical protein [Halomicrobium salinisoli]
MSVTSAARTALVGTLLVAAAAVVVFLPGEFLLESGTFSENLPAIVGIVVGFAIAFFGRDVLAELRE